MRQTRLNEMGQFIMTRGTASYQEICEHFGISLNTARRDIEALVAAGTVAKSYGGASYNASTGLVSFKERTIANIDAKKRIAAAAAELIAPGDIVFFDSGTTVPLVLDYVGNTPFTAITASLNVIVKCVNTPGIDVYTLSGKLNRETYSFQDVNISRQIMNYNITKAFMAASGYSLSGGATTAAAWEYQLKNTVLQKAGEKYLLTDDSKFDRIKMFKFAEPDEFNCIITSTEPPKQFRDYFDEKHMQLCVV